MHDVFCKRQVVDTEDARQHRHHTAGLMPEKRVREFHLHVDDLDRSNFNRAANFENRTGFGELHGVIQIPSLD